MTRSDQVKVPPAWYRASHCWWNFKVDISIVTDLGWRAGIRLAWSLGTLENIIQSGSSLDRLGPAWGPIRGQCCNYNNYLQNPVYHHCHYLPPVLTLPSKVVWNIFQIASNYLLSDRDQPHLIVFVLVCPGLRLVPVQILHQFQGVHTEVSANQIYHSFFILHSKFL